MDLGIAGRRAAVAAAAAAEVGHGCVGLAHDVGDAAGGAAFVAAAAEALGGVDILVPNAGGPPPGSFESIDVEAYPDALASACCRSWGCARRRSRRCANDAGDGWWRSPRSPCASRSPG
jgi:NAD(P)-dependent dehydrogenase (short-subunit alcohol dehydrogenase family)